MQSPQKLLLAPSGSSSFECSCRGVSIGQCDTMVAGSNQGKELGRLSSIRQQMHKVLLLFQMVQN